ISKRSLNGLATRTAECSLERFMGTYFLSTDSEWLNGWCSARQFLSCPRIRRRRRQLDRIRANAAARRAIRGGMGFSALDSTQAVRLANPATPGRDSLRIRA